MKPKKSYPYQSMPTALRNRLLIRDHQIYAQQYRKSTFNSLLQNDLSNLIKKK